MFTSLYPHQREESARLREQIKSEMLSSLKTPQAEEKSKPSKSKNEKPNYEFMGPIGAFLLIFLLPFTVYYINLACRKGNALLL
ncbi:hypothetical protein Btru_024219 [Bulinus truncatus]|nr:hypothetical protein Btru_024219 [Bulinus truncatus]